MMYELKVIDRYWYGRWPYTANSFIEETDIMLINKSIK